MKLLLALCFVLFCTAAFSQTYKRYQPDVTPKYPLYRYDPKDRLQIPLYDSLPRFKSLVAPYKKNGGIVYLPQDNMPCIVPPATTLGQIPNYWRPMDNYMIWSTPNLAEPFKLDK
jgi:hypothetical protein